MVEDMEIWSALIMVHFECVLHIVTGFHGLEIVLVVVLVMNDYNGTVSSVFHGMLNTV